MAVAIVEDVVFGDTVGEVGTTKNAFMWSVMWW
jgi:hypothetical protein